MAFESTLATLQNQAASAPALGKTLKFELGEHIIYIDGTGTGNVISTDNKDADTTISISLEDMEALMSGNLNPMTAFMTGKIKVKGDMSVAMKLQSLFKS